ncbi:hypothetical protein LTR10_008829 [Elasticomyces elasticus]|nr:hypothetical protein LTR10_008829 [Elasticomyces elasticus]
MKSLLCEHAAKPNHKLDSPFAIPGIVDEDGAPVPEPRVSLRFGTEGRLSLFLLKWALLMLKSPNIASSTRKSPNRKRSTPALEPELATKTLMIDPQLLDEEDRDSISVLEQVLDVLSQQVSNTDAMDVELEDGEVEASCAAMLCDEEVDPTTLSLQFIDTYARYNVVANEALARGERQMSTSGLNARDPPTIFMYTCTATTGCKATMASKRDMKAHERTCNMKVVTQIETSLQQLDEVLAAADDPRRCQHHENGAQCGWTTLAKAGVQSKVNRHMLDKHTPFQSVTCTEDDCDGSQTVGVAHGTYM